jgi:hypothetical protein
LGDGTGTNKKNPTPIGVNSKWQSIAGGTAHSLAVKNDGTLWAWGYNASGQLGDGTNASKWTPFKIGVDNDWKFVAAGDYHSLAIKTNGTLWAWGQNDIGQLGDSTKVQKNIPVQIGSGIKWQKATGGTSHSLGMSTNGEIWAWGRNTDGQLGVGTNNDNQYPLKIACPTVGLNNYLLQVPVRLYPNPAIDFIEIETLDMDLGSTNYDISNLYGQKFVINQNLPGSLRIDVSQIPQGFYLLTLRKGNEHLTKSFVKI